MIKPDALKQYFTNHLVEQEFCVAKGNMKCVEISEFEGEVIPIILTSNRATLSWLEERNVLAMNSN